MITQTYHVSGIMKRKHRREEIVGAMCSGGIPLAKSRCWPLACLGLGRAPGRPLLELGRLTAGGPADTLFPT
jgi:hypothetical protein